LDPNRPSDPPDIPVFKEEESSASVVNVSMEGDVEVSVISPSGKKSSGKRSLKRIVVESSTATNEDGEQEESESSLNPRKWKVLTQIDP